METGNPRQALFWAHLAVEKALKAHVVKKTGAHAPFTHSLPKLIVLGDVQLSPQEGATIDEINTFQAETRYDDMTASAIIAVEPHYAEQMVTATEGIVQSLIQKL